MACEDWFYGRRFTDRETRIMVDSITQLSCMAVNHQRNTSAVLYHSLAETEADVMILNQYPSSELTKVATNFSGHETFPCR